MTVATTIEPLLLELDDQTWDEFLDRAASWFGNVKLTQTRFRTMAEDLVPKVHEPHIKSYLQEVADTAHRHEEQADTLFRLIGRDPSTGRGVVGGVLAKGGELAATMVAWAGGANAGAWGDLRQLLLAGLDALGAFALAEQLGYALGHPELAEICFKIGREKHTHQLLIQEYVLEMGAVAVLYKEAP